MDIQDNSVIAGAISVKAVLECGKRDINEIWADAAKIGDRDFRYIRHLAEEKGVTFHTVDRGFFQKEQFGTTHGGIGASVGLPHPDDPQTLLLGENPFLVMLDGIEDPFNFGYTLRTLYAAGCTGVVLPSRNWLSASGTVLKASAGAAERIRFSVVEKPSEFVNSAKKTGIEIIAADRRDAVPLYGEKLDMPLLLILGGEKRGIASELLSLTDRRIYIPYGSDFRNALSAAAAAAVFSFEIFRQRSAPIA